MSLLQRKSGLLWFRYDFGKRSLFARWLTVDSGTKEFWESPADLKGPGTFSQAPRGHAEGELNVSPLGEVWNSETSNCPSLPAPDSFVDRRYSSVQSTLLLYR